MADPLVDPTAVGLEIQVANSSSCSPGGGPARYAVTDARSNDVMLYATDAQQRVLFGVGAGAPSVVQIDARGLSATRMQVSHLVVDGAFAVSGAVALASLTCGVVAVSADLALGGGAALAGDLAVGGNQTVLRDLAVGGSLDLGGGAGVGGDLSVEGRLDVGGGLAVQQALVARGLRCLGDISAPNLEGGFRNRVVNGDVRIDQRNGGLPCLVRARTFGGPVVDRFVAAATTYDAGAFTVQLVRGLPVGQRTGLAARVKSVGRMQAAGSAAAVWQVVEGSSIVDFGWGSQQGGVGGARGARLSFWTLVSVPGLHVVCLSSGDRSRTCLLTYRVPAHAGWTRVCLQVPPDTATCWDDPASADADLRVQWVLGAATDLQLPASTVGSWQSTAAAHDRQLPGVATGAACSVRGATNLMQTPGASFTLTGVQLVSSTPPQDACTVGDAADDCVPRPPAVELFMCRRYFEVVSAVCVSGYNAQASAAVVQMPGAYLVSKRVPPTCTSSTCIDGNDRNVTRPPRALGVTSDGYVLTVDVAGGPAPYSTGVCQLVFEADVM